MMRIAPAPWTPVERFDWATGGRALSPAEKQILQRLVKQDGARKAREPEGLPREGFDRE